MFKKKNEEDEGEQGKKKKGFLRRMKLLVALVVIGSLVFGGMNIKSPDTEVTDINGAEVSGGKLHFTLVITVDNPNSLGAKLIKVDTDVYVDDDYVGPAVSDKEFDIEPNGKSDIEIKLTVDNYANPMGNNTIRVKGYATVKVLNLIEYDKDIDYTDED